MFERQSLYLATKPSSVCTANTLGIIIRNVNYSIRAVLRQHGLMNKVVHLNEVVLKLLVSKFLLHLCLVVYHKLL
jgi:hypothetical protein